MNMITNTYTTWGIFLTLNISTLCLNEMTRTSLPWSNVTIMLVKKTERLLQNRHASESLSHLEQGQMRQGPWWDGLQRLRMAFGPTVWAPFIMCSTISCLWNPRETTDLSHSPLPPLHKGYSNSKMALCSLETWWLCSANEDLHIHTPLPSFWRWQSVLGLNAIWHNLL